MKEKQASNEATTQKNEEPYSPFAEVIKVFGEMILIVGLGFFFWFLIEVMIYGIGPNSGEGIISGRLIYLYSGLGTAAAGACIAMFGVSLIKKNIIVAHNKAVIKKLDDVLNKLSN